VSTNASHFPVRLAVLDMAGTTVADTGVVQRAVDEALRRCGLNPVAPDALRPLRGMAKSDLFAHLTPTALLAEAAHHHFTDLLLDAVHSGELPARPGSEALLRGLRAAGVKTCLMTGLDHTVQDALLTFLGWHDLVDLSVASSPTLRGRPHPDLILAAVLRLRIDAVQSVLVAGDTTNDLLAGTRAGAGRVVGVTGGAHSREQLTAAPHTSIVSTLDELLDGLRADNGRIAC
jgi:phosphoglycolate phosphatase